MITFEEFKQADVSEKLLVAWLEPGIRVVNWTVHSGSVYKKVLERHVVDCYQNATQLTKVASIAAVNSAGKWFFDTDTFTLYCWSTDSSNPGALNTHTMAIYRLFLANMPIDMPFDLASGKEVPYEGIIEQSSAFGAELDSERKGTALESVGSISLYNAGSFLDRAFDRYIWEGKDVRIYLMPIGPDRTPILSEKILLFKGQIVNKDFNGFIITFELADFVFKLREEISLPRYSEDDFGDSEGNSELLPADNTEGTFKKRVYGRVSGMQMHSAQKVEDIGLRLSGVFSAQGSGVSIEIGTSVAGGGGNDETQLIDFTDGASNPLEPQGGTFTLTFDGQTTPDLPYNCSAARLQTELEGLASIGGVGGTVSVTGDVPSGFTVTFESALANTDVPEMTASSSLSLYSLQYIVGTGTNIHAELSPGDELIATGGLASTPANRTSMTPITIETLSRIDIAANSQMTVDFFDNTTYLQIEGVSSEFDTTKLSAGDFIIIKGRNVDPDNRGVWEVDSIPASGTINLVRAAGDGGETETNIVINDGDSNYDIVAISGSNAQIITLAGELDGIFTEKTLWVIPNTPSVAKNRKFFGTHHICSEVLTTVDSIDPPNQRLTVTSSAGLRVNDYIILDGTLEVQIQGIEGNLLKLRKAEDSDVGLQTALLAISASDSVSRPAIQRLFHSKPKQDVKDKKIFTQRLRGGRDYTITNNSNGLYVTLESDAEFQGTSVAQIAAKTAIWTEDSRVVYSPNGSLLPLRSGNDVAGSRAFLSPDNGATWKEIEEIVDQQIAILREDYTGTTGTYATTYRNVEYVTDTSILSADLYGLTEDSEDELSDLLVTVPDTIRHILEEANLGDNINDAAFEDAVVDAPYLVSLLLPLPGAQSSIIRRDAINLLNDTVYGSLYNNLDFEICYKILTAQRFSDTTTKLNDTDVIRWDIKVYSDRIVSRVDANYRHGDVDNITLKEPFNLLESYTNQNVVNSRMTNEKMLVDIYLYYQNEANYMAQKYGFINSTSANLIILQTKLQTVDLVLNDLVEVTFDRLFQRFGSTSGERVRLGVVNSIKKTEAGVELTLDDLGNILIKGGATAENDAPDWDEASAAERRYGLWLTDDTGLIDDEDESFGVNLIS